MAGYISTLRRYGANRKSMLVAYLLWFFLGGFGAHRFYAGRRGSGAVLLLLGLAGVAGSFTGLGLLLLAVPAIWVLVDAFLIPGWIGAYNGDLIAQVPDD